MTAAKACPEPIPNTATAIGAHDSGEMRKELSFYTAWPGVVRPRLAWQTEYLGSREAAHG